MTTIAATPMRTASTLVLATLALGIGWTSVAVASTTLVHPLKINGAYWKSLTQPGKQGLVVGFIAGFDSGWSSARLLNINAPNHSPEPLPSLDPRSFEYSQPSDYYVGKIDNFYQTYPDLDFVPVDQIFNCLTDRPAISCDSVAEFWEHHKGPGI